MENIWKEILNEILNSEYVKEFVSDILKDIKEGKKAFEGQPFAEPYGFGEGCYYKSKRAMLEDAIYQAFEDDIDQQCPTLLNWLWKEAKSKLLKELEYGLDAPEKLNDFLSSSHYGNVIRIEVDYNKLLEEARENIESELKNLSDEDIENHVQALAKVE
jgi:hypothetical protein